MIKTLLGILFAVILICGSIKISFATIHIIETADYQFTQNFDSILVGDTVKWVWISGDHTATSNGIPFTAAPWNVLIDKLHTSFTYVVNVGGTYNYISVPDAPQMDGKFVATWPTAIADLSMENSDFNITGSPGSGIIKVHFYLSQPAGVNISLHNIFGVKSQILYDGYVTAAHFSQEFFLSGNITAGLYLVTVRMGDAIHTRRVVIQ
jgi:plastocyanin